MGFKGYNLHTYIKAKWNTNQMHHTGKKKKGKVFLLQAQCGPEVG